MRLMTQMKLKLLEAEVKVLQFRMLNKHFQYALPMAKRVVATYHELLMLEQTSRVLRNMGMN